MPWGRLRDTEPIHLDISTVLTTYTTCSAQLGLLIADFGAILVRWASLWRYRLSIRSKTTHNRHLVSSFVSSHTVNRPETGQTGAIYGDRGDT